MSLFGQPPTCTNKYAIVGEIEVLAALWQPSFGYHLIACHR